MKKGKYWIELKKDKKYNALHDSSLKVELCLIFFNSNIIKILNVVNKSLLLLFKV